MEYIVFLSIIFKDRGKKIQIPSKKKRKIEKGKNPFHTSLTYPISCLKIV